ncbi:MAG: hypothetical protein EZS28_017802 [Streblomastix strix]|uniref:HECT domain-containing protein n=1 Tax=Streblomastix strix TaxID=222440 RepID=A0A5J4VW36_9EUKA|nr:MAG: hypothetical protein EZS28_017802 [Streblomastix strix]
MSLSMRIQEHGKQNDCLIISEFNLPLCGQRDLDDTNFLLIAIQHNFTLSSLVVIYFWEIVEFLALSERRQIIRFITGSQVEQVKRFAHFIGADAEDYSKFLIALMNIYAVAEAAGNNKKLEQLIVKNEIIRSSGISRLRVAYSSFNTIDLLSFIQTQMSKAKMAQIFKVINI